MIDEYLVEIVSIREPIVIIIHAKPQVVELWQVITQAGDDIETGKIKFRESVVEEELLADPNLAVERPGNAWLILQSNRRCHEDIILFAPADERGIGGPIELRGNRNREWFVFFRALYDLLFAAVFIVSTWY